MSDYKFLVNDFIIGNDSRIIIGSDENLEQVLRRQLGKREAVYTTLLQDYSKTTKQRNGLKEFHKWAFFWAVMLTGFFVIFLISAIIKRVLNMDNDYFIRSFPIIITSFISLISTVIGIPMTITRFLFNTQEDDNITNTIHHTQEHDSDEVILLLKDKDDGVKTEESKSQTIDITINTKDIPKTEKKESPGFVIVPDEENALCKAEAPDEENALCKAEAPDEELSLIP